ncbi:MAG: acyl-CoA dehydratase activase-related protein [Candidatus Eisenbacteria bacterium]|nr:acyl-CoA dehydratase activase-related protein [Candidatus Eisenbacteria bacterium]
MRIAIPRSLLFYRYFPFWESFFSALGYDVVVSKPSTKETLDEGVKASVPDVCLPIKVALGHVIELANSADRIFLPRYLSLEPGTYSCPKIIAFTDMAKGTIENLPPILDPVIDLRKRGNSGEKAFFELGKSLGAKGRSIREALEGAKVSQGLFKEELVSEGPIHSLRKRGMLGFSKRGRNMNGVGTGEARKLTVGVLGRPYCLYDSVLSLDLLERLAAQGLSTTTIDCFSYQDVEREAATLPFSLYWLSAREIVGGAYLWLKEKAVDGIIYLIPFQCGPDALLSVLVSGKAREARGIPFMPLVVDEHTGESGIVTRLEAFLDMLKRRK